MKIITKITCLLTTFIFLFLNTSCSKINSFPKLDPENPQLIKIWHYYNGAQKLVFDKYINEFNKTVGKEKGIIIEAYNKGGVNDLGKKAQEILSNDKETRDTPDIVMIYSNLALDLYENGKLAELDDYLTSSEIEKYIDSYIEEGRMGVKNKLVLFPVAKSTEYMIFNKTRLDEFYNGISGDKSYDELSIDDLNTWEGINKTARNYYRWTDSLTPGIANDGKAFFGLDSYANYFLIGSMQLGNEMFTVNSGEANVSFTEDTMYKLFSNLYIPFINGHFAQSEQYRTDDIAMQNIVGCLCSSTSCTFMNGKVTNSDGTTSDIKTITLKAPIFENGEKYCIQQGAGLAVRKSTKEKEYAATVFLKWFTESSRNIDFLVQSAYLPVTKEAFSDENQSKILEKISDSDCCYSTKVSMPVLFKQLNEYKMYVQKPYKNGDAIRAIVENNLQTYIKNMKFEINQSIELGEDRNTVINRYTEKIYFTKWYNEFRKNINEKLESE